MRFGSGQERLTSRDSRNFSKLQLEAITCYDCIAGSLARQGNRVHARIPVAGHLGVPTEVSLVGSRKPGTVGVVKHCTTTLQLVPLLLGDSIK